MNVILYTTHCPKCNVLEKKLKSKNIVYKEITDTDIMLQKGFDSIPILEVNGIDMNFTEAVSWINKF